MNNTRSACSYFCLLQLHVKAFLTLHHKLTRPCKLLITCFIHKILQQKVQKSMENMFLFKFLLYLDCTYFNAYTVYSQKHKSARVDL